MTDNNDAKARRTAQGLIQGYIGPDHKVLDMKVFHSALVQALREAQRKADADIAQVLTFDEARPLL
ncbi:MAG: hypothetical protein WBV18_03865 [Methyloceanibacter sp.]|jgi:hypothetical protein|uniref:hypothetical protein n=1 Tax=Methyloceanibacter sp. TaxID=1965321 RepID=UPI003C45B734